MPLRQTNPKILQIICCQMRRESKPIGSGIRSSRTRNRLMSPSFRRSLRGTHSWVSIIPWASSKAKMARKLCSVRGIRFCANALRDCSKVAVFRPDSCQETARASCNLDRLTRGLRISMECFVIRSRAVPHRTIFCRRRLRSQMRMPC